MEYFPVKITLSYKTYYLIWCSDSLDKVFSINGVTPSFYSFKNLMDFSSLNEIELVNDITYYDLGKIKLWCKKPISKIEVEKFLNIWNFFGDVAAAYPESHLRFEVLTQKYIKQYNKLFYGSNLPSIKTTSRKFNPQWSQCDLLDIRAIFLYGFEICKARLRTNYE